MSHILNSVQVNMAEVTEDNLASSESEVRIVNLKLPRPFTLIDRPLIYWTHY